MSTAPESSRRGPAVVVQFDRPDRCYGPGDRIEIRYQVEGIEEEQAVAVERSVAWYTEGKGEEDLCVHFFDRVDGRDEVSAVVVQGSFGTELPLSPLSYEGVIVKIRWCIRVRIFFRSAKDFVSEHVFELGRIPAARIPSGSGS